MPKSLLPLLAALCPLLFACASAAAPAPDPVDARLAGLRWLVGTWRMQQDGGHVEETWLPPRGTTMFGVGQTVKYGETLAFEYLRIEARPEGLVYVALPGGRGPGTEFAQSELTDEWIRFDNPAHDFPTWIRYRRVGPDACVATVGDEADSFDLDYTRQ